HFTQVGVVRLPAAIERGGMSLPPFPTGEDTRKGVLPTSNAEYYTDADNTTLEFTWICMDALAINVCQSHCEDRHATENDPQGSVDERAMKHEGNWHTVASLLYQLSCPAAKVLFECLAATDICVGLFSQPPFVTFLFLYIDLGNTDIDILYYVEEVVCISNYVLFGLTVLISTAISVYRLLVLLLRLRYRQVVTPKRTQAVILLCWIIAVSCGLVRVWSQTVSEIVAFVAVVVSLVTSVFCYVKIHLRLQRYQAEVEDNPGEGRRNNGNKNSHRRRSRSKRYRKGKSTCMDSKRFIKTKIKRESSTKHQTISENSFQHILGAVGLILNGLAVHALWLFTKTLVYLNSSLDPFLYCWKITEVRKEVKDTARAFCCCCS
ncbi:hypothetical protein pdam_00025376, partial [Pocillopora damicornis]